MRDINLIPRKPFAEKAFVPLLAGTIGVSVLAAVLICTYAVRYNGSVNAQIAQIGRMQQRIEQLNALRQVDPRTQAYNKMNAELAQLKENRINWLPIFALLSQNVPPAARIVTMGVKDGERMTLNMEFADWKLAADYAAALQQSGLFGTVQVSGIEKQEKRTAPAAEPKDVPTASGSAASGQAAVPAPAASGVQVLAPEQYVQSVESGQKPAASKSDELLNELNWIINRQASKQQLQTELPDKTFQSGRANDSGGMPVSSPFSPEELAAARKSLDDLKQTQIKETADTPNTTARQQPSEQSKQTEQPEQTVTYYNVTLNLTLKPLSKSKQGSL